MNARLLLLLALPLTFVVVVVGAFVRLSDAGLGCPDWPGCYGKLIGVADEEAARALYPDSPYDVKKAWIEVGHRYIAGALGLLLIAAAVTDFRRRRRFSLTVFLAPLVIAQALMGMLTVTEKLKPVIVTGHLLGGMLLLALIAAGVTSRPLSAPLAGGDGDGGAARRRRLALLWGAAAAALLLQLITGGWVSANYAGIACPDFPLCHGGLTPPASDFSGFAPWRDLHQGADGGALTAAALTTIHWVHRATAMLVLAAFAGLITALARAGARGEALGLSLFLLAQIIIGIINVIWQLPLWAAVAHNAFAALLVVNIAVLGVKLGVMRQHQQSQQPQNAPQQPA